MNPAPTARVVVLHPAVQDEHFQNQLLSALARVTGTHLVAVDDASLLQ